MPILLPVTDNLLFLNQRKREIIFPHKNVPDMGVDLGTAANVVDMLPSELQHPVLQSVQWKDEVEVVVPKLQFPPFHNKGRQFS